MEQSNLWTNVWWRGYIWISNKLKHPLNGCGPVSFQFDVKEICGKDPFQSATYTMEYQ